MSRALAAATMWCALALPAFAAEPHAQSDASLQRFERRESQMGTQARIVLYAADASVAERAMQAGFDRIAELDRTLSDYRDDSELMRVAARAGRGPVPVSEDLFRVLSAGQALAERSGGAFDVTSGALTRLWRGARRLSELPSPERIAQAHAKSGYRHMRLNATTRTVAIDLPGIGLDVGGIAKGYAADEALSAIESAGVQRALVALGGDIAVSEAPPGKAGWDVQIAALSAPGLPHTLPTTLQLRHSAVSTAGDAEQWFEVDGRRYSHLIDPRSGWPMQGRSTTTVIARRGVDADGLDTAAALLGPDEGARLVHTVAGAAMRMERETAAGHANRVRTSSGWPRPPAYLHDGREPHASHKAAADGSAAPSSFIAIQ